MTLPTDLDEAITDPDPRDRELRSIDERIAALQTELLQLEERRGNDRMRCRSGDELR